MAPWPMPWLPETALSDLRQPLREPLLAKVLQQCLWYQQNGSWGGRPDRDGDEAPLREVLLMVPDCAHLARARR